MPQVIPFAVGAIATAAGASAITAGALSLAASFLIGGLQQRKAKKQARADYNAAQVDRMANVVTSIAPRELVLGRVRKGGGVAFRASAGGTSEKFVVHLTLAAHEIDAVEAIYLNDKQVTIDPATRQVQDAPYKRTKLVSVTSYIQAGGTSVVLDYDPEPGSVRAVTGPSNELVEVATTVSGRTVSITEAEPYMVTVTYQRVEHSYFATILADLGAPGAVADAATKQYFPGLWSDSHRGEGIAKLVSIFEYDDTAFPNGVPAISALIRGAKVYDPRDGATRWTENPALHARHVYQHQHFGKATVTTAEDVRISAAANACDVTTSYVVNGVTEQNPLYRCGLVIPFGTTAASALDDICQAMGGMWAFAGGELYLRAGTYSAPVLTFSDTDVVGTQMSGGSESQESVTISVHRERAEKFNVVNVRIWDAAQEFKEAPLAPLKGASLITADGEELSQELPLPGVSYAPQALHIAGVMMRDARDPLTIQVALKMRAYPVELFDTVSFSLTRYGWDASPKTFMVLSRVWDRQKGLIRLTCKETNATIYNQDVSFAPGGYGDNTALPDPWNIEPPGTLTITSGTDELQVAADGTIVARVRVTWPLMTDQRITNGGQIEVQWADVLVGQWNSLLIDGSAPEASIPGLSDGAAILVRARTRTSVASSDWGIQQLHIVVGKTELPPDVAVFSIQSQTLSWSTVDVLDIAGYQVRFNYGTSTAWGTATPLHAGLITESPWTPSMFPPGQITLLVKAQDTTGNQSANPAAIVANLGDVIVQNVILSYDDKAAGFPGDKTNSSVSGGNLVANDSGDLFWGDDGGYFWQAGGATFWPTATYLALQYELQHVITSMEAGSRLTLDVDVTAESYTLEYRFDSQDVFWRDDAEFFWDRPDSAYFWPPLSNWLTWPGGLEDVPTGAVQFRITTQAGLVRGTVSTLTLRFDVEDEFEEVDDVAISSSGTRLPITKTYRQINNIQLTLQDDGGSAVSAQWVDKNATLGPLVQCINSAGALVAGVLDARIQGVKG